MASLTGQQINNTYQSLLKTEDNAGINNLPKALSDGAGTKTGLQVANPGAYYQTIVTSDDAYTNGFAVDNTGTTFGGAVDFSGATVTGLPGGGGAPAISFVPSTPVSFTGPSSNDTIIASALIPANTFASGDVLEFTLSTPFDFSAGGWIYSSVWIYTDNTTIYGGDSIGQIQAPSGRDGLYKKILYINDTNTQYRSYSLACDTSQQVYSGDPWYSYAINWTVDQYINVHSWVDNAGTIIYVPGFTMKKIN